jgi:hypothetical protein
MSDFYAETGALRLVPNATPFSKRSFAFMRHAVSWLLALASAPLAGAAIPDKPDYNKHVRPILAGTCFKCHGSDEKLRKGKLRLDLRDAAVEKKAIVPGNADASELVKRILTTDEDDVMPPRKEHRDLTADQKEILRRWIAAGAEYQQHWSFIPPVKAAVPQIPGDDQVRNEIDSFVRQRLAEEQLSPAPETTKERWLRRVTLDLTGLPPTLRELDEFLADTSGHAFDAAVDRLLASESFGERMATDWLDAARYADTYGRHEDAESAVWRYRDWVVQAFNENLPYDKFLTWQTAGDLLPNPTRDQYIATVFNRLVQQSNEAGSNEEEFRQDHVNDRVKTNATAILGLTMECARCHDHKYDPITQRDYYSFSAFLNNIDELGLFPRQTAAIPAPSLLLYGPAEDAKHRALVEQISAAEKELETIRAGAKERFHAWCREHGMPAPASPAAHYDFESVKAKKAIAKKNFVDSIHPDAPPATSRQTPKAVPRGSSVGIHFENDNSVELPESIGAFRRSDAFSFAFWFQPNQLQDRAVLVHRTRGGLDAASRGYEIILEHGRLEFTLAHFAPGNCVRIRTTQPLPLKTWTHVTAMYDGSSRAAGMKICLNGKCADCEVVRDNLYRDILYRKEWGDFDDAKIQDNGTPVIKLTLGWRYNDMGLKDGAFDDFMVFDRALTPAEAALLAGGAAPRIDQGWWDWLVGNKPLPANADEWLDAWLRDTDDTWRTTNAKLHDLRTQDDNLVNDVDEVMVMREMPVQRPTFVLNRGQFDQHGAEVTPDTPKALPPFPEGAPRNRLGLAQWMVDGKNPLTARVAVNRIWQIFFGRGLVATSEDFGIQGQPPSHPELLDWLACDFMEHGWDVKRVCRMIALSATYRQDSVPVDSSLLERDPQNILLARGPRHRLSAEQIRDTALSVSGLLVPAMGGVPVMPYLPDHLYEDSGIQAHYIQDHGGKLWRRSLYTFRKRTMPPPDMLAFDSPSREFCRVRRECTNTPLQALTLMNDPQFVEACRVLAEKLLREHPKDAEACIAESFRLWTSRAPTPQETAVLHHLLDDERSWFSSHPSEAESLRSKNGEAPTDTRLDAVDVAAVTELERALLGDDETLVEQ